MGTCDPSPVNMGHETAIMKTFLEVIFMKWVEIIEFRAFNPKHTLLELDFWNSLGDAASEAHLVKLEVYTHSTLPTDVSIHLHYDSAQVENQGSLLGLRLVSELKALGVVNHNVWIENFAKKKKKEDKQ
jgi:hypothetical protein